MGLYGSELGGWFRGRQGVSEFEFPGSERSLAESSVFCVRFVVCVFGVRFCGVRVWCPYCGVRIWRPF